MNKECCGVETLVIRKNDLSFEFLNIYTDSKRTKYSQRHEDFKTLLKNNQAKVGNQLRWML